MAKPVSESAAEREARHLIQTDHAAGAPHVLLARIIALENGSSKPKAVKIKAVKKAKKAPAPAPSKPE